MTEFLLETQVSVLSKYTLKFVGAGFAPVTGVTMKGLPEYTQEDVAKHKSPQTGIWMTYKDGVYDVTSFMQVHPGGGKIWLAAGDKSDQMGNGC